MIPQYLIEKALELTNKKEIEICEIEEYKEGRFDTFLSYPKFFYYLLSPEFIEKYNTEYCDTINCDKFYTAESFGMAIYEYQKGNPEPIIDLLSKI